MINSDRVRKALEALRQAERELEGALADVERPRPATLPKPVRMYKQRSMRRVKE